MKMGKILLQALKIGGKVREIRVEAVTVSKETIGKDLLTTGLEKKIVLGGWKQEIERVSPLHPDDACCYVPAEGPAPAADDDGNMHRIFAASLSIPKLSGRSKRIELRIPKIGQKASVPQKIRAVQSEVIVKPQAPVAESKIIGKIQVEAAEAPKIGTEVQEELVPRRRRAKVRTEKSNEMSAPKESSTLVTESAPSEPEVPRTSADLKFQVVPTPRKRQPKVPETQVEPAVSPTPKPIKVIRRRAEEAPKVFETAPKTLPKAMLEGVKLLVEEEGDNPIE